MEDGETRHNQEKDMLTLTRKPEETIVIGDGAERIEVIVKEIRRNQVRLGIVAPENVRIFRKELIERDEQDKPERDEGSYGVPQD